MRHIGRWMLNALTVLSLLMCMAVTLLLLLNNASIPLWDSVREQEGHRQVELSGTHLQFYHFVSPLAGAVPTERDRRFLGFVFAHQVDFVLVQSRTVGFEVTEIIVPTWAILLVSMPLPIAWQLRREQTSRRLATGRSPHCSYDLTANVSGVCPECGTKIAEAK